MSKKTRKPLCPVCRSPLRDDGKCTFRCPLEASPKHLRSLDKTLRERQRRADRGDIGAYLTPAEASAGVAKAVPGHIVAQETMRARVRAGWKNRR